jgi:hypothetical protein
MLLMKNSFILKGGLSRIHRMGTAIAILSVAVFLRFFFLKFYMNSFVKKQKISYMV